MSVRASVLRQFYVDFIYNSYSEQREMGEAAQMMTVNIESWDQVRQIEESAHDGDAMESSRAKSQNAHIEFI